MARSIRSSELRISYEDLRVPHGDCNLPPTNETFQKRADQCHVLVTVTDGAQNHLLRFDRSGDRFDLSTKPMNTSGEYFNSQEKIGWFFRNPESATAVLNIVKVLGAMLHSAGVRQETTEARAKNVKFPMVLANYIVTGRAVFPDRPNGHSEVDLAKAMLYVFATSPETSVKEFIRKISYLQKDDQLSQSSRDRIAYVVSTLEQVVDHQKFFWGLFPEKVLEKIYENQNDPRYADSVETIQRFIADTLIDLGMNRKFQYGEATEEAFHAYDKLLRAFGSQQKSKYLFCEAVDHAIRGLKGVNQKIGPNFTEECRNALKAGQFDDAKKEATASIVLYLNSSYGRKELEATIKSEIRRSRMTSDWLAKRGQLLKVSTAIMPNFQVRVKYETPFGPKTSEGDPPKKKVKDLEVFVDAEKLGQKLDALIAEEKKRNHREPVITALGMLRLLFGKNAKNERITTLVDGEYRDVPLSYDAPAIQEIQKKLEADLHRSFLRTDVGWPVAQGVVGGLGAGAMIAGLSARRGPKGVRQGLFIGGCSAVGFSLGSMVQYSKRAKNKHMWGAVGGVIGSALTTSICATVATQTKMFGGSGSMDIPPDEKYPVDEYGP